MYHNVPLAISSNPVFAKHAAHFSPTIGKHLGARLDEIRTGIKQNRNSEIISAAWALTDENGHKDHRSRSKIIFEQQLRYCENILDDIGEQQITDEINRMIGDIPDLPHVARWAGANAADCWKDIKQISESAAEKTALMTDDELECLVKSLSIPGQFMSAKIARICDPLWIRKRVRSEIRRYRADTAYRLDPLHINRASVDSQFDNLSQNSATDKFIDRFGSLKNKQTGEIIKMPTRAIQQKRKNAELMARKKSISNKAKKLGLAGFIVTMTCPSKFHPTTTAHATQKLNPRFDRTKTIQDAHRFLTVQWRNFQVWCGDNDIICLGMRAVHPHKDSTPHWHFVMLVHPSDAQKVEDYIIDSFHKKGVTQIDFQALKPMRQGQDSIDAAMSYAAAYLSARHIEGEGESSYKDGVFKTTQKHIGYDSEGELMIKNQKTTDLYQSWRRDHGFREFSFFEFGLGKKKKGLVTAWRLLRKRTVPEVFQEAFQAGDWLRFEDLCHEHKVKLTYKNHINGFGEIMPKFAGIEMSNGEFITADSDWKPLWKMAGKLIKKEAILQLTIKNQENLESTSKAETKPKTAPIRTEKTAFRPPPDCDNLENIIASLGF